MNDKPPTPKVNLGALKQLALATELPFLVAAGAVVGGLVGYFLDHWLHTKPYLMIILGALGFFAAVRDMLRRLNKSNS
jgi:ATP synthase protein I